MFNENDNDDELSVGVDYGSDIVEHKKKKLQELVFSFCFVSLFIFFFIYFQKF